MLTVLAGNLTKCESYKEDNFGHGEPPMDLFSPICNVDGSYQSIQCHGFRGECWCVDEEGRFIYGTEVQAARPDCSPSKIYDSLPFKRFSVQRIFLGK